jgi:hypothetical protein
MRIHPALFLGANFNFKHILRRQVCRKAAYYLESKQKKES